jgi:hypothetical protein
MTMQKRTFKKRARNILQRKKSLCIAECSLAVRYRKRAVHGNITRDRPSDAKPSTTAASSRSSQYKGCEGKSAYPACMQHKAQCVRLAHFCCLGCDKSSTIFHEYPLVVRRPQWRRSVAWHGVHSSETSVPTYGAPMEMGLDICWCTQPCSVL